MKYLLDKKIKTPDEMRSRYRLPLIGFVRTEENARKGLDGWLDRMRSRSWGTGDTPENIGNMITAMDFVQGNSLCGRQWTAVGNGSG